MYNFREKLVYFQFSKSLNYIQINCGSPKAITKKNIQTFCVCTINVINQY